LADDRGRPVAFSLTPGNVSDIIMAIPLLEIARPAKRFLVDKAYDADSLRSWLGKARIKAVGAVTFRTFLLCNKADVSNPPPHR
jgi:transposase